jgi:hypothetical protein
MPAPTDDIVQPCALLTTCLPESKGSAVSIQTLDVQDASPAATSISQHFSTMAHLKGPWRFTVW